jgi:hypothetical protein
MEWIPVCEKDFAEALRATLNWKALEETKYQMFGLSNSQQHTGI